MHSSDHGHQQLDENPFSHLAQVLDIEMDRPSANPFDNGIMPSFDDRAIEEDYRNQTAKKFGDIFGQNKRDDRPSRSTRQQAKQLPMQQQQQAKHLQMQQPIDDDVPAGRPVKDVQTTATLVHSSVRESEIVKQIPDVELDLDDFPPKLPIIMPSIDLKPQINIRSRNAIVHDDKPRQNAFNHRKPVPEPVITKPVVQLPVDPVPAPTKPIIDYFGTQSSNKSKQEVDQKEEYFRESQLEANKILFGVEEPPRPLTNVEVSKRKKLILKLVDQKLKMKLTELMSQLGERSNASSADTFADQMENLMVPDSIPDNLNSENTQNWTPYPSEVSEQSWNNFQPEISNSDTWRPIRPEMYQQSNAGWIRPPQMNPYPPGVDPMHNARFPTQPHWNPNPWNPNMRPPEPQWQQQQNTWNMPVRPINPHSMQPNVNAFNYPVQQHLKPNIGPVPPVSEKPSASDIALELKEKEFLERTIMGSKNKLQRRDTDNRRRTPEKFKRRSRSRSRSRRFPRDRATHRSRDDRERSSEDRLRDRSKYNRSSSNRSERIVQQRGALSPSSLSPLIVSPLGSLRNRSLSGDFREYVMYDENHFESEMDELMAPLMSRSRSVSQDDSRSEDLRVRLSQRRNKHRSRSPTDLRNKLSNDDLRNQLAERSRRKRTRSHSRDRSSRKTAKIADSRADGDSEWMKFNNIVGMLMNIDMDADLTTEEMSEKKEIMKLLLENPDLLELDENFVYKFGKGRLNLAVKEAENILYPNGVPDERIATLISKKIAALSTEKKTSNVVTKDTVPIEWIKLGNLIDQVLHLTIAERNNLSPNDKRMIERDELLVMVSDDPNSILTMGTKYGHRNVEWASKYAKKILYRNDVRDKRVFATIAKERTKALDRIGKMKRSTRSRHSSESHRSRNSTESDSRSNSIEWNQLCAQVTKLVQCSLDKFEKMSRDDEQRRDDLLVQMSRDPDAIRSNTKFTDNVDKAILDDAIEKCKEIIASVKSNGSKDANAEFERQRTKLLNTLNYKTQRTTAYDQIMYRISGIFGKKQDKWTTDEKKERETLTEALIKDPDSLRTNTKALERIGGDKVVLDEIIADVKQILSQLDPSKARGPKKFHISSTKVLDIPFVVRIVDASDQLNDTTKTVLLKSLRDMITEIENPPKPKLLQQRYVYKCVEVVCANLLTFEWLKRIIVSDFKDKWSGADLKIERVPVETKIPRDKLKPVSVVFKDSRATMPFDNIVREIRRENSKLYPERWELLDGRGKNGDYKQKTVGIDIESLAALEQMNRFARLGRSLVYFDISYMGDNVPNFEATCQ